MKGTIISLLVAVVLIFGAVWLTSVDRGDNSVADGRNVSVVDGQQIIEIRAKGGYEPRKSLARAGLPTVLRFNTDGTFDCSLSVRIPSLNISQMLSPSGVTDIDLGNPAAATLQGTCGMGMYPFEIEFQDGDNA